MVRLTSHRRHILTLMIGIVTIFCSPLMSAAEFQIFDATSFTNKPDLRKYGFKQLKVLNAGNLWPEGSISRLHEPTIRSVISKYAPGDWVALDITHWWIDYRLTASEVIANIDKFKRIADIVHSETPGINMGYHALMPRFDYWAPVSNNASVLAKWHTDNARAKPIADKVDAIFPRLYTPYNDPKGWVTAAKANIAEAKKYGKPVYVFLWPEYEGSGVDSRLKNQPIPAAFWRLQLETVKAAGVDGVVFSGGRQMAWNKAAPWWIETQKFLSGNTTPQPPIVVQPPPVVIQPPPVVSPPPPVVVPPPPVPQPTKFQVFDTTVFGNKPDLSVYGIKPMGLIYSHSLWPAGVAQTQPHEPTIRSMISKYGEAGEWMLLDIEHWIIDRRVPVTEMNSNIQKFKAIADIVHSEKPGIKTGFYSMVPMFNYHGPVDNVGMQAWQEDNRLTQPIADKVDAVFPHLYTFYNNQAGWVTAAKANIAEAKRYGKPVYVFLWPEYQGFGGDVSLAFKPLPADFWKLQMETVKAAGADGIVIWGGYDLKANRQMTWNESAPWWGETKSFMSRLP